MDEAAILLQQLRRHVILLPNTQATYNIHEVSICQLNPSADQIDITARDSNIFPLGALTPKRLRQGLSYGKKRARRRKGAGAS